MLVRTGLNGLEKNRNQKTLGFEMFRNEENLLDLSICWTYVSLKLRQIIFRVKEQALYTQAGHSL